MMKMMNEPGKKYTILTLLYLIGGFLVVILVSLLFYSTSITPFINIEKEELDVVVTRFNNNTIGLSDEYLKSLIDYSQWDDTYDFVENQNQQYLDDNFSASYIEDNLGVNFVAITDIDGLLLFNTHYIEVYNNQDIDQLNEQNYEILGLAIQEYENSSSQVFYVETNVGLLLLELNPITKSEIDTYPNPNGYMFFGVLIDESELHNLANINGLDSVILTEQLPQKASLKEAYDFVPTYFIKSEDTIAMYFAIPLLANTQSSNNMYYEFDWTRATYNAGVDTARLLRNLVGSLLFVILLAGHLLSAFNKKNKDTMKDMIIKDHLTGLYNRRYYEERVLYYQVNEVYPLSLVMADINGLKLVNDAFGHNIGDELLISAANIFRTHLTMEADICRVGGDEFIIILPEKNASEAEQIVAEVVKHAKQKDIDNVQLSISFGVASREEQPLSLSELYQIAEDRMYQAKLVEVPSMHHAQMNKIMSTVTEKDPYVESHVRNVSILSERLANALNLLQSDINVIRAAGMLHDIGKIIIPSNLLNIDRALTSEEYAIIKTHSEIGYRILNSSTDTKEIADIVLYHHERYDGTGYPKKLSGENIPLGSRIIGIADAFDAMTSYRAYSRTLTKEEALAELKRCSGTQFDPNIVAVFEKNFNEIISSLNK